VSFSTRCSPSDCPLKRITTKAIAYAILNEEPEVLTAQRSDLPLEIDQVISKALAKEPAERYQTIGDMLVDLRRLKKKSGTRRSAAIIKPASAQHPLAKYRVIENVEEANDSIKYVAEDTELHRSVAIRVLPQSSAARIERQDRRKRTVFLTTAALGVLLALVFAFFPLFSSPPVTEAPLRRFTLPTDGVPDHPSISPDGRHVSYVSGVEAGRVLWVQDLDQNEARAIVGPTSLRKGGTWSPDSQFLVFQSQGTGGALNRVSVAGGPVTTLLESGGLGVGTWTPDGESVLVSLKRQLYSIPAAGGEPEPWLEAQQEGFGAYYPSFFSASEGSRKLLYVEARTPPEAQVIALDRTTGQREVLAAGHNPLYAPSGHVIYETVGRVGIWAVPFSVGTMKATGNPFPISKNAQYPSVAADGTLVYLEGAGAKGDLTRLVWRDRQGNRLGEIGEPYSSRVGAPGLSPEGSRLVVQATGYDIWIHEIDRPVKTRLLGPAREVQPSWSPRGDRIVFTSTETGGGGARDLHTIRADGSEDPIPLLESTEFNDYVSDWSEDGNTLLVTRQKAGKGNKFDIWRLQRKEGGGWEETPFLQTEHDERFAKLSPDGRFIAYQSNQSGEDETYIRSFPDGTGLRRVSANGGRQVRWRKDGKELFYVEDDSLMAVPVTTTPALTIGAPEKLFSDGHLPSKAGVTYDVTADGQRFILSETEMKTAEVRIRVVENWLAGFKDHEQH